MATTIFEKPMGTDLYNKVNISDIANNLTTDTAGKVLDARQGKALAEQMANIMSKPLKKQNVPITTSAAGNAGTGLRSTIVIISAHAAGYICSPFYLSSSNEWYINVINPDGTKATNVSITAVVTYQDN